LSAILLTKLHIPRRRPDSVPRPRLVERLNAETGQRITLISAPAGFGKTTLLAEWIATSERCVTWLSLDAGDNDPALFWGGFLAGLQRLDPNLGQRARSQLESPQAPPIETLLAEIINDISACPLSFVHVFDDYHFIANTAIDETLTYLLEHLPPNLHVILASRADPALPLARWRGRGHLTEIRARDLRFTVDEVAAFLWSRLQLELPQQTIAALESRTEGWAAGLQLAALSMQGRNDISGFIKAFSGSHRHVLSYLVGEVLDQRPKGTLDFLRQTSILDRMCAPLCEAVTGRSGGQTMLETLDRANMFVIPLDDEGVWYRYHHLFAEVLQQRLHQTEPEREAEIYRRASEWFEQSGLGTEAIEYALRGRDWLRAMRLIEAVMSAAQLRGEVATLLRWLGTLPDEAIQARPTLCLGHALILTFVDEFRAAEERLLVVERGLLQAPLPDAGEQAALLGQVALVRETAALVREYPGEAILAAGHEALRLLPESDLGRRGYALNLMGCAHYLQLGDVRSAEQAFQNALSLCQAAGDNFSVMQVYVHLSQMRAIAGRLSAAEAAARTLCQLANTPGWEQIPVGALGNAMLGRVLYERNDLAGAREALAPSVGQLVGFSFKRPQIFALVLLARVTLALGEADETRELLDRAWRVIQKNQLKQVMIPAAALRARMLLQMGDVETAKQWAATVEVPASDPLNPALEYDYITVARVCLAQGRIADARQLLARLRPPAEAAGRVARAIEILALQAVAAWAQQGSGEAMAALERALALGEPEGFVRSFVDEGEPMRAMLERVPGERQAYARRLLAAFEPAPAAHPAAQPAPAPGAPLLEPLRDRELEVLRLIAEGYSNQEISGKLVVGVSTVKTHINHLFQKLGVSSRTQAIARGRELGLLPG
jgi:LuxR family maltose regulon positive regulatory protein